MINYSRRRRGFSSKSHKRFSSSNNFQTIFIIFILFSISFTAFILQQKHEIRSEAAGQPVNHFVTFYGYQDNDPPSSVIDYPHSSYPQTIHEQAGGTGTYDDPLTMATDPTEWAIGTRMYLPFLRKYIIMEDWCTDCVQVWTNDKKYQIDIWLNSDTNFKTQALQCEVYWTQDSTPVEVNPPSGRPVFTGQIFNTTTGRCLRAIPNL